jgi:hypothetical protein
MTVTTFLLSTLFGAASLSIGTRLIFGLKCHVIHQRKELFMPLLSAYWLFQVAWFESRYRRLNSPLQWSALLSGAASLSIGTRLIFGLKCHVIHQRKELFMSLLSVYWLFHEMWFEWCDGRRNGGFFFVTCFLFSPFPPAIAMLPPLYSPSAMLLSYF